MQNKLDASYESGEANFVIVLRVSSVQLIATRDNCGGFF